MLQLSTMPLNRAEMTILFSKKSSLHLPNKVHPIITQSSGSTEEVSTLTKRTLSLFLTEKESITLICITNQ